MGSEILIIAGEVSGDMHGSALVHAFKKLKPEVAFTGIGGDEMQKEGVNLMYHVSKMSFLGLVEVIKHLPFIKRVKKEIITHVRNQGIKHAVLIDYPGFNLSLAKSLKKEGVNIIYYISPQIWAWGRGRITKIKKLVDKMLVILPFEEKLYRDNGVDCDYVGHPLVERINNYCFTERDRIYIENNLDSSKGILLVQPGSRKQEVLEMYPVIIMGARRLAEEYDLQIVVNCSPGIEREIFEGLSADNQPKVIKGFTYELMKYATLGIVKSGTSTLEAGLMGLPMVIVYKANPLTYLIGRTLVKLKNIGLINIVMGKTVVPELIQGELTENGIYTRGREVMARSEEIKKELLKSRTVLGEEPASERSALMIASLIG